MPAAQLQQRLRRDRPLKMQVQLALGQATQPINPIDLSIASLLIPCHLVSVVALVVSASPNDTFSGAYLDLRPFREQDALRFAFRERRKSSSVQCEIHVNRMFEDWIHHPARMANLVFGGPVSPLGVTPIVFCEELLSAGGFDLLGHCCGLYPQLVPPAPVPPLIAHGTLIPILRPPMTHRYSDIVFPVNRIG